MDLKEIAERAQAGDRAGQEQLLKQLLVSFRVIVQRKIRNQQDAEEVVQDALLTVFQKFRDTSFSVGIAAWAHGILRNKMFDYFKLREIRTRRLDEYAQEQTPSPAGDPDPMLLARLRQCFEKINKTNRKHARILNLHFQGYSTAEICRLLGITSDNLYVSLSRARSMFEACLFAEDDD